MNGDIFRGVGKVVKGSERRHLSRLRDSTAVANLILLSFKNVYFGRASAHRIIKIRPWMILAWTSTTTVIGGTPVKRERSLLYDTMGTDEVR